MFFVCGSVCLSVSLSLFLFLSFCLPVSGCFLVCLRLSVPACVSLCLIAPGLFVYAFLRLSVCVRVCLPACLSA